MSAATQTKIFGMKLGVDPKLLVVGLLVVAGGLYWFNSRDNHETGPSQGGAATASQTPGVTEPAASAPEATARTRGRTQRRRSGRDDRETLRLQNVTPANGEIDPVLRLDLLSRLAKVDMPKSIRNLFETGPAVEMGGATTGVPVRTIVPTPLPVAPTVAVAPPVATQANIPLKYYGFARPTTAGEANRGFFLDGDDIVVAAEGQMIQRRYLVVQLTGLTAKLEDTQVKLGQMLPVVPEATDQGGMGYGRPGMQGPVNPGFGNQQEEPAQP